MKYKGSSIYDDPEFSRRYADKRKREDNPNDTLEKPVILALLGTVEAQHILDLGCGDGQLGHELLQTGASFYHGIDGSKNMVEAASAKLANRQAVIEQQALEDWHFPSEKFDVVISRLVLHYIENVDTLFLSIFKTLKAGGSFIFSVEHPVLTSSYQAYNKVQGKRESWVVDNYFRMGERENIWEGKSVIKYHKTVEAYFQISKQAGFLIDDLRESEPKRVNFENEAVYQRRQRIPLFLFFKLIKPMKSM